MAACSTALVSACGSQALDREAQAEWGLHPFALVEAAGRALAQALLRSFPGFFCGNRPPGIAVLSGGGNNAADALVLLRTLILEGRVRAGSVSVLYTRIPGTGEKTPFAESFCALQKLAVSALPGESPAAAALLAEADIVIDGVAGTGLHGPLRGAACAMIAAVNKLRAGTPPRGRRPLIVSIDAPSGSGDLWQPGTLAGSPVCMADCTLAIEPQKRCLYIPALRPFAGTIVPVGGIFPSALVEKYRELELFDWESAAVRIPPLAPDVHKYRRGVAEIRAGSTGAAGAAKLAALGAQAAGAGIVRLIVDSSLYPILAPALSGIMTAPDTADTEDGRFAPNAVLVGPGWGRGADRQRLLEQYLPLEERGLPLILDADAIALAKNIVFHGSALLTPHPGEFAAYTGIATDELLADPVPALRRFASEKNAHILLKGHVSCIAAPSGRVGFVDGMNPALAAGGSGDVLAGFCAAIAARQHAGTGFDGFSCALAAASLLQAAARSKPLAGSFADPEDFAKAAAFIAGRAWLPGMDGGEDIYGRTERPGG
jgi:NAD(P)H-hydrate epimerase